MLFARQRLLLALLDSLGGSVRRTDFQKLLLLFTRECEVTPSYDFVPYHYGGFSFTSYADKRNLVATGLLEDDGEIWTLTETGRKEAATSDLLPLAMAQFCQSHAGLRGQALVAESYRRHPFYAINSRIIDQTLTPDEAKTVAQARPSQRGPALFSIGYEGKSLESYLNVLLRAGVTLLCDVRRNPLSRKYGFSKTTLSTACEGVGLRYEHLPALGIATENRRNLHTQADYDALFTCYVKEDSPARVNARQTIRRWIEVDGQAVALTCFERDPQQCHRSCVAGALEATTNGSLQPIHL